MQDVEKEFIETMAAQLPPVIARRAVGKYLGDVITPKTLSNADGAGTGPEIAYRIGRTIVYRTDTLLEWIVSRYGVQRLAHLNDLEAVDYAQHRA